MFALADNERFRYANYNYFVPPPASAAPPALPPSVEEAYRRKCIQLKQRTSEVEDANDAARLRLARLKRQCEKMRLERAFLLEQLAKRTSTNVEDSDGSPSPPPTVRSPSPPIATAALPLRDHSPHTTNPDPSSTPRSKLNRLSAPSQPKEKPLRIKRGHRKPSMLSFETPPAGGGAASSVAGGNEPAGRSGSAAFLGNNNLRQTQSPSSDAFSAQPGERSKANGLRFGPPPRKPGSAFDLYSAAENEANGGGASASDDKDELARGWKSLDSQQREAFESRAESEMAQYRKDKDAYDDAAASATNKSGDATEEVDMDADDKRPSAAAAAAAAGDDTEMGIYDTDPEETMGEKPDE
ncbi:Non-histone protein 10 [Podospora conica]|nr:Non-histone protein 10 [Schizothecium conicum]